MLILDLSIPKNVASNVTDLENVTLIHLDQLSKITDDTLKRRQQYIPKAEAIIAQITKEFKAWLSTRAFAPTIQALKSKLNDISALELNNHRKKIDSFNEDQAHLISDRLIQKITNRFANHLRNANGTTEQSIEFIKAIFELEQSDSE